MTRNCSSDASTEFKINDSQRVAELERMMYEQNEILLKVSEKEQMLEKRLGQLIQLVSLQHKIIDKN